MWIQPPRAPPGPKLVWRSTFLAGLLTLSACQKPPIDVLVDRSVAHLQAAVDLMRAAHGDDGKLLVAAMHYRAQHHAEFVEERSQGEALLRTLNDEDKRGVETRAKNRTGPLLARIETESQKFPEPRRALRYVRPLIVAATPKPRTDGKMPWLPEVPDLPPELLDRAAGPDPAPAPAAAPAAARDPVAVPAPAPGGAQP